MGYKKVSTEDFITRAKNIFGDRYEYHECNYTSSKEKVKIICKIHGEFLKNPNDFISKRSGCPFCRGFYRSTDDYIKLFKEKHDYDYSETKLLTNINSRSIIPVICKKHGTFQIQVNRHLANLAGCQKCGNEKKIGGGRPIGSFGNGIGRGCAFPLNDEKQKELNDIFISEAKKIHGETYTYNKVNYSGKYNNVIVTCPKHGEFQVRAHRHLDGSICGRCAGRNRTLIELIELLQKVHGDFYDYSRITDVRKNQIVEIGCPIHGWFDIHLDRHSRGTKCFECCKNKKVSKYETQWLDSLNIPERQYWVKLEGRNVMLDGYDPKTNTAYEFYGDYWHGNPKKYNLNSVNKTCGKTYKSLYDETMNREKLIKDAGYNLITIWQSEWKN